MTEQMSMFDLMSAYKARNEKIGRELERLKSLLGVFTTIANNCLEMTSSEKLDAKLKKLLDSETARLIKEKL